MADGPAWAQTCMGKGALPVAPRGLWGGAVSSLPGVLGGAGSAPTHFLPTPASHSHWAGKDTRTPAPPGWAQEVDCLGLPPAPPGTGGSRCQAQPLAPHLHCHSCPGDPWVSTQSAPFPPRPLESPPTVSSPPTSPWLRPPVPVSWGQPLSCPVPCRAQGSVSSVTAGLPSGCLAALTPFPSPGVGGGHRHWRVTKQGPTRSVSHRWPRPCCPATQLPSSLYSRQSWPLCPSQSPSCMLATFCTPSPHHRGCLPCFPWISGPRTPVD